MTENDVTVDLLLRSSPRASSPLSPSLSGPSQCLIVYSFFGSPCKSVCACPASSMSMSVDAQSAASAATLSLAAAAAAAAAAADEDSSLSHTRVASLSQAHRKDGAEDDSVLLLVPGTNVVATSIVAPPPSPQPLLPFDDAAPSTPVPSRPSSALTPPLTLPAARTLSSIAASSSSSLSAATAVHEALNSSDSGLHLSGEKPVRSLTGTLQPTPAPVPISRQLSRQSSNSDAPLPTRSTSVQPADVARVLRVTNEALSLRKQSLRHAAGSMTPPQPIDDVSTLRALLAFQNKEIAAYKQQITTLTTDNNRLAAELRAFPHSASEVNRVLSSLREERSRMDARIRALEGEKKVWAQQMRNLHGEMNSMEREWIKDRQRLEEAVRREEERNERLMADWDDREERIGALLRERKRETDEHDKLKADMRDVERRLEHAQAEYGRLVSAWREERLMGTEVEGRLRGEVYARLFGVMREVANKEAESREWEREMGRKKEVQLGVDELERRYVQLLAAVAERDELLSRLREDNRRLLAMMRHDSVARVRSMQLLDGSGSVRSAATAHPTTMHSTPRAVYPKPGNSHSGMSAVAVSSGHPITPSTFPSWAELEHKDAAVAAADEAQLAQHAHNSQRASTASSQAQRRWPAAALADGGHSTGEAATLRTSLPTSPSNAPPSSSSSSSSPSPVAGMSTAHRSSHIADGMTDSTVSGASSGGSSTGMRAPPTLLLTAPSTSTSASASPASMKSPTSFLSAFFASAAAALIPNSDQPTTSTANTPRRTVNE